MDRQTDRQTNTHTHTHRPTTIKSTWQCITFAHKIMMHVLMTYNEHEEHTCTCMALLYNVTRSKSHTPRNVPVLLHCTLLLHCTQSVERAQSLINAHLSGREKPSPQSVPWPSLSLLQLDFTLQGTSQLFLHARSLINAHPNGREKPSPQSVSWPSLLHTLAAASVDTACYNI